MSPTIGRDFGERVLPIRVDTNEGHALCGIVIMQFRKSPSIEFSQWTFGAQESNHHQLGIVKIMQRPHSPLRSPALHGGGGWRLRKGDAANQAERE